MKVIFEMPFFIFNIQVGFLQKKTLFLGFTLSPRLTQLPISFGYLRSLPYIKDVDICSLSYIETLIYMPKKDYVALLHLEKASGTVLIEYSDFTDIPTPIFFQNSQLLYYLNTPASKTTLST